MMVIVIFTFFDYRFSSPVFYWDPARYGSIVSGLEVSLFVLLTVWLWRQEKLSSTGPLKLTRLRATVLLVSIIYAGFLYL